MFPFKLVSKEEKPVIHIESSNKFYQAEEISAMVLTKMKETAEAFLGKTIKNAVVTVPGTSNGCLESVFFHSCLESPDTLAAADSLCAFFFSTDCHPLLTPWCICIWQHFAH